MAGFVEVMLVAAGLQLAVLPGEKVQFIIAALSTRYDPRVVVAAAGTAFALWTAVEVAVGGALKRIVPGTYLTAGTGLLFLAFAVMMVRSAPAESGSPAAVAADAETDGGVVAGDGDLDVSLLGHEVPSYFGGFLPIFTMMALGEFGDKTQLVTFGLATTYGATPAIWVGEMLAIVPVSAANAYFFSRFAGKLDLRKAHLFSAALFGFFALDTALSLFANVSVWETVVASVADAVGVTVALPA